MNDVSTQGHQNYVMLVMLNSIVDWRRAELDMSPHLGTSFCGIMHYVSCIKLNYKYIFNKFLWNVSNTSLITLEYLTAAAAAPTTIGGRVDWPAFS